MKSTFKNSDCIFLLKDLTGIIMFTSFEQKEKMISEGVNYSEMITEEAPLSKEIHLIFEDLLHKKAADLAYYISIVSEQIYQRGKENGIIVSLARAGTPIGALIKRYIKFKYKVELPHYSISIIRDKGIDQNALNYICALYPNGDITFVDGWTGKGSIAMELNKSIKNYNEKHNTNISSELAVLADPARLSSIAGTRKDICIPNACLNSTVSGLVSRTILNERYILPSDFHGAVRYDRWKNIDVTNHFLDVIESSFNEKCEIVIEEKGNSCVGALLENIKADFPLTDINKVKLSIGESSRALIRRKPYKLLVKNLNNPDLTFILYMARKKKIEVILYDTMDYECVTLIK